MPISVRVLVLGLAVLLFVACQPLPASPTVVPATETPASESSALSPIAPPATETSSSEEVAPPREGQFYIDRPVNANATVVTGNGPAGTAIVLYNVTNMGIELGGGVIGEDGRFEIQVEPLVGNTRIGIQLAEADDAVWADKSLLGPEALVVPLVGTYVDTALVAP